MPATVTIGMPLFKSARFLGETLDALLAQTFEDFRVVMSVDGNDLETATFCQKYLDDSRFELTLQKGRLGWAENLNWCMRQAQSEFFQYWQHDDVPAAIYIERLVQLMRGRPDASIVYCDVQTFGESQGIVIQQSVEGTPLERAMTVMEGAYWTPFRGLVRLDSLARIGPICVNAENGALDDMVWLVKAAREGALVRLPEVLYKKRMSSKSESGIWNNASDQELRGQVWAAHGAGLVEAFWPMALDRKMKWEIVETVFRRLVVVKPGRWMHCHVQDRVQFASKFLTELDRHESIACFVRGDLESDEIVQRLISSAAKDA